MIRLFTSAEAALACFAVHIDERAARHAQSVADAVVAARLELASAVAMM